MSQLTQCIDSATGQSYSAHFVPALNAHAVLSKAEYQAAIAHTGNAYDELGLGGFADHHMSDSFRNCSLSASQQRSDALNDQINGITLSNNHKTRLTNWRKNLYSLTRRCRDFGPHMVSAFESIAERQGFHAAMRQIQDAHDRLRENNLNYTLDAHEIRDLAKAKARAHRLATARIPDVQAKFLKVQSLLADLGLSFPTPQNDIPLEPLINRACCEDWLRRQIRRVYLARVESVARDLQLINKAQSPYCSAFGLEQIKARSVDSERALTNTVLYKEDDPSTWFTLYELAAKSVSNPTIRRAEMFVRLRAFEEIAKESGHVAMFYTVTAPSRFHVYRGDDVNPNWLEAGKPSVLDTHEHLMGVHKNFGRELSKLDIKIYGMRIVEPHHDGTPHHHMLYFMRAEHQKTVTSLLRRYALQDSPTEKGARKYRFKSVRIDFKRKRGSAVGYVAKYLSKNIDGAHIESDRVTDKSGKDAAASVVAFARLNGIRQFQFIGGPSITAWRELRRFRNEFKEDDALLIQNGFTKEEHFALETVRRAADEGDFKTFVMACGGVFVSRKDIAARPLYFKRLDLDGLVRQTRYGDEMAAQIVGITMLGKRLPTRFANWKFANKKAFIRGVRAIMGGVKTVFETLEEELEYHLMQQEEFERMQDEIAFLLDVPAMKPAWMYSGEIYGAPPEFWGDPLCGSPESGALDLCQ
ncbi:hypothetical protein VST7929_03038 [Vibrio stylophorae]|uniref:Replication gene A protein-like domain-containing protein n=1 Tax=Vibrio stylophorae TaxID=659351 RepID=A0ABN8DYW1_9VIBR|nr:replication endonuclease [Vibrio stylophorae]CAH0535464.1 hypothetical protein VST7929_03038 [Vibrio stylophorae]